ncbi:hypothetical protein H1C71_013888 [Ictidomys tridecemlineatus]|nr:hypothetical protein H1C71_013888 [Ictidomys tridecemlineatus]KAG3292556.1 hypothetical protein H1C71_013888 [Ictidomys tridecemlineatus]KAG3292557.1 hypothetical protein H1C71_013888 [Ictidomys tridecemlineatus]KAG3292558.1 hypothetical protein H1C71_013888 [Ictidomys tridecemlineatus]
MSNSVAIPPGQSLTPCIPIVASSNLPVLYLTPLQPPCMWLLGQSHQTSVSSCHSSIIYYFESALCLPHRLLTTYQPGRSQATCHHQGSSQGREKYSRQQCCSQW